MNIQLESVLAAIVHSRGGSIEVPSEDIEKDYSDKVLAIDYDQARNSFLITLLEESDVDMGDESETE